MSLDLATAENDILEAIDLIRPALQSDGGDIVFLGLDEQRVAYFPVGQALGNEPDDLALHGREALPPDRWPLALAAGPLGVRDRGCLVEPDTLRPSRVERGAAERRARHLEVGVEQ